MATDPITGIAVAAALAPFGIILPTMPMVKKNSELENELMKKPSAK